MSGRVLFYVQHLLGVGHLRRAEILADAMAAAGLDVTVAFGGAPLPEVPFHNVRLALLPAAQIANEDFSTLLDETGRRVDADWRNRRRSALIECYQRTDPHVVLIELFPFGRRQFRFELSPLLEVVHAAHQRPQVACSVRDILVTSKKPARAQETAENVRRWFDMVLVHGDPALIRFETTFPAAAAFAERVRYTGYVVAERDLAATSDGADERGGEVIVSAGGGAVGGQLLMVAMAAKPLTSLKQETWRFLAGPNLPEAQFQALRAAADRGSIVERFIPDLAGRLENAALSISQAGYNTTMDILTSGVRAVVVPYEAAGETEQRLRADILAKKGVLQVVPEAELTPDRLAGAVEAARLRTAAAPRVDMRGAQRTARLASDLAAAAAAKRP